MRAIDDIGQVKFLLLPGNLSVKDDLKQQVAQFILQFRRISGIERIEHFVCFFDQHGLQRLPRLLLVPGTSVFATQLRYKTLQAFRYPRISYP